MADSVGGKSRMPFDPLDYQPQPPPGPRARKPGSRSEDVLLWLIVILSILLLLLPITPEALVDLVAYLRR